MAKAKLNMDIDMNKAENALPKVVDKADWNSSGPTLQPHGMLMPLQRITNAVALHITIVSAKTSKMPQRL